MSVGFLVLLPFAYLIGWGTDWWRPLVLAGVSAPAFPLMRLLPSPRREVRTSNQVQVTVFDPETGDTETRDLPANDYILICGARRTYSVQAHSNGTHVITVKTLAAEEPA